MRGEGVTGSGPEPQAHSQHDTQPQPGEPISLRDVLRAVSPEADLFLKGELL